MSVNVNIDDSLTCYGVHWNVDLPAAQRQFEAWGFRGISGIDKLRVLNGNPARREAIAEAKRQGAKWYMKGNYDAGVTDDSAIYRFSYTAFTGDLISGSGDWESFAGWSGHS